MSVLIIAEAGVNHNGNMEMARELIDVAAEAGADIIKFQTFSADRLVSRTAKKAAYQAKTTGDTETQYDMLRRLELQPDMHESLMTHCRARGVGFLSTGFDIESVRFLHSMGAQLFKIPSGEITNLPYLRYIGRLGGEVVISTGMSTLGEIESAIEVLERAGTSRQDIVVLHCTTEYPAPLHEVNLRAMNTIKVAFGVRVGYSDHTPGIEVPIAAFAMGAEVVEKHFTLDRSLPGPDHLASLEPPELKAMIAAIRNVEIAMGDGVKRPTAGEWKNRSVVRKSIVALRQIRAGEIFDDAALTTKRPGDGISPMCWDDVVGRIATRDFAADEKIEL